MNKFIDKWYEISKRKNSNICAGLDPSLYEVGRGEKGLPKGIGKLEWSLKYIETVAPYVVAVKPNAGYFGNVGERGILKKIADKIHQEGLLAIIDSKISDIGSTSEHYIYDYQQLGFDALTIAPYAGNMEQLIEFGHQHNMAVITMGLMSNPEYKTEMNFKNEEGEKLWASRVKRGLDAGVDGLVVGGTYTTGDRDFIKFIEITKGKDILYLVPGIGAQGGEIEEFLASGIEPKKCIINSGRGVMFPNGSKSTPEDQAKAVKELKDSFNNLI